MYLLKRFGSFKTLNKSEKISAGGLDGGGTFDFGPENWSFSLFSLQLVKVWFKGGQEHGVNKK